jgi:SAF domain
MNAEHPVRFRPTSRSRTRIAVGALLVLGSVAAVLLAFDAVDRRVPVLQVVGDVPAGEQIREADLRVVEVSNDPTLPVVAAADIAAVVGTYAKVRIVGGALLAQPMLQTDPLVADGSSVVAVGVVPNELPVGLRERSQVLIVMPRASTDDPLVEPVRARVVGLPTTPDQVSGTVSVSLEVAVADAVAVASSAAVRIVLLEPGVDAALTVAEPA